MCQKVALGFENSLIEWKDSTTKKEVTFDLRYLTTCEATLKKYCLIIVETYF